MPFRLLNIFSYFNIHEKVRSLFPRGKSDLQEQTSEGAKYLQLGKKPRKYSFAGEEIRFAFYSMFFAYNSYAIKDVWHAFYSNAKVDLFDWRKLHFAAWLDGRIENKKMSMFCLNGGHGYDVVGFCQWWEARLKPFKLSINATTCIVDREVWFDEPMKLMDDFENATNGRYTLWQTKYLVYNNFSEIWKGEKVMEVFSSTDLVTVVKFLSLIDNNPEIIDEFVKILESLKPGAMLFFMDEAGENYLETMREIASRAGLTRIGEIEEGILFHLPGLEAKNSFARVMPQATSTYCTGLWRKIWK